MKWLSWLRIGKRSTNSLDEFHRVVIVSGAVRRTAERCAVVAGSLRRKRESVDDGKNLATPQDAQLAASG